MFTLLFQVEQYSIPQYNLSANNTVMVDDQGMQYLGQPDSILLADNQTILTVYPKGHGLGAIVLRNTTDGGQTWSDPMDVPASWATSHETPTLYTLDLLNGTQWII